METHCPGKTEIVEKKKEEIPITEGETPKTSEAYVLNPVYKGYLHSTGHNALTCKYNILKMYRQSIREGRGTDVTKLAIHNYKKVVKEINTYEIKHHLKEKKIQLNGVYSTVPF